MQITKIETDDDPIHDDYIQTASVWFDTGGHVRFVEDTQGRVFEQAYTPDDPHSITDDIEIDGEFNEILDTSLEVWFKDGFPTEFWDMAIVSGEGSGSPTNLEYTE